MGQGLIGNTSFFQLQYVMVMHEILQTVTCRSHNLGRSIYSVDRQKIQGASVCSFICWVDVDIILLRWTPFLER